MKAYVGRAEELMAINRLIRGQSGRRADLKFSIRCRPLTSTVQPILKPLVCVMLS